MTIKANGIKDMVLIVAGLVREGLTFEATEGADEVWTIKLTGGY